MIRIRRESLEIGTIADSVRDPASGAVAVFTGVVRNENEGRRVQKVRYEAYESMALRKLSEIADRLKEEFDLKKVALEHRIGDLQVGEVSLVLAVSSPHRSKAFEALRHGIDLVKAIVPIWKREFYLEGDDTWIDPGSPDPSCGSGRDADIG